MEPQGGTTVARLYGREVEQQEIDLALMAAREGRTDRLWIHGVPGSGKTALCRWATERAEGFLPVGVTGVEGEEGLSLAGLLSALRPLRQYLGGLAPANRSILERLLSGEPIPGVDVFALGASALALIARAAEEQPLLLCVDDLHWLDQPSALALGFAVRRLERDAVAVVFASRTGAETVGVDPSFRELRLEGLDRPAGRWLLADRRPISPVVADGLVTATGGLPLAMVELVVQLDEEQLSGRVPLADPPLIGGRSLRAFEGRLKALDDRSRTALAVAAAAGSESAVLLPALAELGLLRSDRGSPLVEAEKAGLIRIDGTAVEFSHPLVRSAALSLLEPEERRRIHAALASVTPDAERRAAHLMAAATGSSEELGDALEAAAEEVGRRLGSIGAAGIWRHAALATPPGPARVRRLTKAILELSGTGRPDDLKRLADEVMTTTDDPEARTAALLAVAWVSLYTSSGIEASDRAISEASRLERTRPELGRTLRMVGAMCLMTSRPLDGILDLVADVRGVPVSQFGTNTLEAATTPGLLALTGRTREAWEWWPRDRLEELVRLVSEVEGSLELGISLQLGGLTLLWLGRPADARQLIQPLIARLQSAGQPSFLPTFYAVFGDIEFRLGRWADAAAALEQSVALAEQTGQDGPLAIARSLHARVLALRGETATAVELAELASRYSKSVGFHSIELYARSAIGLAHLCDGDYPEAAEHLAAAGHTAQSNDVRAELAVPYRGDLCEALVLSGDLDRAERERAVLAVRAREDGIPWLTVVDHRAAGLIAWRGDREVDGRDALAHFQAALEVIPDGYEGARTRLLLGEFLADRASRQEAREVLDRAATEFDRLGARPFAERARQVLGDRVIDLTGPPSRLRVLTGQEHQVAVAVAEGLSNKEIAARLFISTKTVEHHLTRSYQKLGIRSRTELARRILLESGTPAKS